MPPETPVAFGLHPNAEIGFKLREGDRFCTQLQARCPAHLDAPHASASLQGPVRGRRTARPSACPSQGRVWGRAAGPAVPAGAAAAAAGRAQTPEERAKSVLDDLLERMPELFDLEDIRSRIDELTPYIMVAIQARAHPPCFGPLLARPRLPGLGHLPGKMLRARRPRAAGCG